VSNSSAAGTDMLENEAVTDSILEVELVEEDEDEDEDEDDKS